MCAYRSPKMYNVITAIWAIFFIIAVLGCIPYGIWIILTAIKKRWQKLSLQIAIPVATYILLLVFAYFGESYIKAQYDRNIYDSDGNLGDPIYEHHPERSFNGDGSSISIYDLPPKIRSRFENPDSKLLEDFPKRPDYRDDWKVMRWREAPIDEEFNQYTNFALFGASNYSSDIKKALSRKGTYYAFFYYDHGENPGNIDFFIVDLVGGRIYSINVNT